MREKELIEFCKKTKLLSGRDTDRTVVIVFREVLDKGENPVGSTELARLSGLHRLTVRHHLERLREMGLLEENKGKYSMKFDTLEEYIEYRRRKMLQIFKELENIAERMDREFFGIGEINVKERKKGRKIEIE